MRLHYSIASPGEERDCLLLSGLIGGSLPKIPTASHEHATSLPHETYEIVTTCDDSVTSYQQGGADESGYERTVTW